MLMLAGEWEQGEAAFARAERAAPRGDRVRRARLLRRQGYSRRLQRRSEDEAAAYTAAEAALGDRPLGQAWWEERCHLALSWIGLFGFTAPERLQDSLATYRPLVERHGTAEQRSASVRLDGRRLAPRRPLRRREQTLEYYRAGLAAGRESRIIYAVMWMGLSLGLGLLTASRLDEAEAELTDALGQAELAGDAFGRICGLTELATLHRRRGDVAGARRLAESALEEARAAPSFGDAEDPVAQARANLAWIAWREGDHGRAEELAREAWQGWDGHLAPARLRLVAGLPAARARPARRPRRRGARARRGAPRPDPPGAAARAGGSPSRRSARGCRRRPQATATSSAPRL